METRKILFLYFFGPMLILTSLVANSARAEVRQCRSVLEATSSPNKTTDIEAIINDEPKSQSLGDSIVDILSPDDVTLLSQIPDEQTKNEVLKFAEQTAIAMIDDAALNKVEAVQNVKKWIDRLSKRQSNGEILNVVEHSALIYLYRNGFFQKFGSDGNEIDLKLKNVLSLNRERLTGQNTKPGEEDGRLPWRLLIDASPEARIFYSASYRADVAGGKSSLKDIALNYLPRRSDLVAGVGALTLAAIAFDHSGGQYIAAPIMGYIIGAVAENIFHRYGTHGSKERAEWLKKKNDELEAKHRFGFSKVLYGMFYNHTIVHHGITFRKSYTQQFMGPEHEQKVDSKIQKDMGDDFLKSMQDNNHGISLSMPKAAALAIPLIPIHMVLCHVLGLDPIATALLMAPGLAYPGGVKYVHEFMHMTRDQIKASAKNKGLMSWFLKTRYVALMSALHRNHHRDQDMNFNLAYPPGDVLFATMKLPTMSDLARMRQEGILGTKWGDDLSR